MSDDNPARDPLVVRLVKKDWLQEQDEDENHARVRCMYCDDQHLGELFQSPPSGLYVRYYCAKNAEYGQKAFP